MANLQNSKHVLQNYSYKKDQPYFTSPHYEVYEGSHKDTKVAVTIKILNNFHPELAKYLKKLKQTKSENIIRVYELAVDSVSLVMVTQHVAYGNLGNALKKCQRLEQGDAISVAKLLLNGYVDLLRNDCTWYGKQEDVQFTGSGIKISWNNSISFKGHSQSPLWMSKVLQKISNRSQTEKSLLPFPKNKIIQQLINVSKESASQISLNSQLKIKQKPCKKKGKNWIAIKQVSSKNEYLEQYIYLAVSAEQGFLRVKIYDKGSINPQILALNKTNPKFAQVIDCYDDGNKKIIVSNYSNDGSMQGYVARLKGSGTKLTEEHIEYLFYSLFEPLKQVQSSSIKSIGMLNIKNIYIENGIPKIGQPVPMNINLQNTLKDRQAIPDFYHPKFKRQPSSKSQLYDTYSLGVLLYKLMYTQYPIFPQNKVHIPTAPSFNKRLKTTLEILLNKGGSLQSIQSKIEISETVAKQVKQNVQKLQKMEQMRTKNNHKKSVELTKRTMLNDVDEEQEDTKQQKTSHESEEQKQFEDQMHCCIVCCHALELDDDERQLNRYTNITTLEQSPYKVYRICTKVVLVLIFYIFLFYFFFLKSNVNFLSAQSKLQTYNVTIATKIYPIITDNVVQFQTQFNKTTRTPSALKGLGCLIDEYEGAPNYSDFLVQNPSGWIGYLCASLISFVVIMLLKAWKTYHFDVIRAIYNWDHGKFNYNITNFIIYNLQFSCLIYGHYYLFNLVFDGQLSPCYGSANQYYHSSWTLLNDSPQFVIPYVVTFIGQALVVGLHWIMKWKTHQVGYNKLINPIILFTPFLITQWLILRIGVLPGFFYPNGLQQNGVLKNYFTSAKYIDILGTVPQILWVCQILIGMIIDAIYWMFLDKRRRLIIQDTSAASLDQTIK